MGSFPIYLSIVLVVRNKAENLNGILNEIVSSTSELASDYEIIIIDNASDDDSISKLKSLTTESGLPNLQIYALTKQVDRDVASWVGMENSLGDFVAVLNPFEDEINFLPKMLAQAVAGIDVVFANNQEKTPQNFSYRVLSGLFNAVYKKFNGVNLAEDAPQYRLLSKRVVNFLLQHSQPALCYRHLPATAGFSKVNMRYRGSSKITHKKSLGESIDRGIKLLVSSTQGPMRVVATICLFGAVANLTYSVYVVAIALFNTNTASGWVSLSLQQSGMFFLLSLAILFLGEYLLIMSPLSSQGPLYFIAQEFRSVHITGHQKLNVEEVSNKFPHTSNSLSR